MHFSNTGPPAWASASRRPSQRLFCYGTLQLPSVLEAVIGRPLKGRPAWLPGFGVFRVRGEVYPGLNAAVGSKTPGILYDDVAAPELSVLDRFEGRLYRRTRRVLTAPDGRRIGAWVYMPAVGRENMLTRTPWRLEAFMRAGYRPFMQRFVRDRRALYAGQRV